MRIICGCLFFLFPIVLFAQKDSLNIHHYPQDYFRNPLDIPIFLAGNFGECRPGHFHSGIDIKTLGKENQPVHAAADGYISRIKMEKGGFGHAIYITHPNGYTTLYAHLNNFVAAIQNYVHTQQYEKERWDVDLQLSPDRFPVKKGQQIAWSGNTGASTAPHLHFEIRNTNTEHPLNPQMFGLPLTDNIPPIIYEAAIYDLSKSIYAQEPKILSLKAKNGIYLPLKEDTILTSTSLVGVGLYVKDFMNGSDNDIAFYTATLYMDSVVQVTVRLDNIGYDESRYINAYADYKTHELNKKWIQCLFELPGNKLDHIYENLSTHRGCLDIGDTKTHQVHIVVTDDKGNTGTAGLYIKQPERQRPVKPAACMSFAYNAPNYFSQPNISFSLNDAHLYDNICFEYSSTPDSLNFSARHQVHHAYVPLQNYFNLNIRPDKPVPFNLHNKIVMRYSNGDIKEDDGRAAIAIDQGWYTASIRNFGTYWLVADTVAPVIRSMQKNGANLSKSKQISFVAKDALTSVKRFRGELDGKWVCFEQHGELFFYKFDEHCGNGKHKLVFKAVDENDNERSFTLNFTR